jgi:hypothetical protein
MRSSLLASVDIIEFLTKNAYSSLDLTYVIYNLCIHSGDEKVKVMLLTGPNSLRVIQGENVVNVVMKMKFIINNSQVFNRVGPGYGGLAKLIIIDESVGFPGEGCNFSFTDVDFHTVSSAPTLNRVNVRL